MPHGHGGSADSGPRLGARFDCHRFDNYSAWLDMEDRKKARREGRGLGFGYAEPVKPPPVTEMRPFYVQETSMTSGLFVTRRYDLAAAGQHKTEACRSDAHHFPNYLEVEDKDHYGKFQRLSQNLDKIPPNPDYSHLVDDTHVKMMVAAHKGESRSYTDPERMKVLFEEGIRLPHDKLHEVNADLSCLDLPHCEKPRTPGSQTRKPTVKATTEKWGWCMGGRKPMLTSLETMDRSELARSQTLPSLGKSLEPGAEGKEPHYFHGEHKGRTFGVGKVNARLKGGSKAASGWAGTAPFDPNAQPGL